MTEYTNTGPIESKNNELRLLCPACKENRNHIQTELDTYHPNRIGVDDRNIRIQKQ